jgi:hypothetical protein
LFDKYNYRYSFSCPSDLDKNAETVEIFKRHLKKALGEIDLKYAYSEDGRKLLVKCKKKSFLSLNARMIDKMQKVNK